MTGFLDSPVVESGVEYQVERSLRLRKSASASVSRTPGAAGNRKLLSLRFRIKRGEIDTLQVLASAGTASIDRVYFDTSNRLCLDVLGAQRLVSTPVFRDSTAWYVDVEVRLDVANGTAAQRAKLLVSGTELAYTTDDRASITNTDTNWCNTVVHYLGRDNAGNYFDGRLAEPILVDGAVTSTYAMLNAATDQQMATRPSATYGTTGFFFDFSDPTSLTTLMADRSGNGNNGTANNVSLTAGATYDSMLDVPLGSGGSERANYATLSNIDKPPTGATLTDGNLSFNSGGGGAAFTTSRATIPLSAQALSYWECVIPTTLTFYNPGVMRADQAVVAGAAAAFGDAGIFQDSVSYRANSYRVYSNGSILFSDSAAVAGDVLRFAYNRTTGKLWVGRNSTWFNSGDPAAGTGEILTLSSSYDWFPGANDATSQANVFNFGQRPFAYTPPTGFKALHTGNITSDTVVTSGSFIGNLNAFGPTVWLNGTPDTLTINGNAVTWGTHADKVAGGFKLRTSLSSYNNTGTNTFTATVLSPSSKSSFRNQNAKANP